MSAAEVPGKLPDPETDEATDDAGRRSDAALLADHVAGEADAFAELVRRHRDRLWAVALRTTGDREEAADGLQDGIVAAYRRAATFRGDAAVTTWLHRVVVNACLDRMRASRVRRAEPLPEDLSEYSGASERHAAGSVVAAAAPASDPADSAQASERRAVILAALSSLPAEQRAAVVLVDLEGFSVAETAAILECRPGTVKSRCSRARAALRPMLEHLLSDEPGQAGADGSPGNRPATAAVPPTRTPRAPPGPR